ncbi:hypothetical protein [Euzebya sp.]|uniref:hypothetical protein n=1 Tax=Euzebya sp. TaxID=1971409 RepID=UPI003517A1F0
MPRSATRAALTIVSLLVLACTALPAVAQDVEDPAPSPSPTESPQPEGEDEGDDDGDEGHGRGSGRGAHGRVELSAGEASAFLAPAVAHAGEDLTVHPSPTTCWRTRSR